MKVAVIGANGQLGCDVVAAFAAAGHDVVGVNHGDMEIAKAESVTGLLSAVRPELVINTAAMHHVEKCEAEAEKAYAVNGMGTKNLALAARDSGAALMHVSTDYVFDGTKYSPYVESDAPMPLNVYGNTKLAGEHFVRATLEKHFVLRTSAIYGVHPCRAKGMNFIELMLKLARERGEVHVVDDEFVTPTSTSELAKQMLVLADTQAYGLYHASGEGSCSWFEFAEAIFEQTQTKVVLKPAAPGEFPIKVARPKYSVMENQQLNSRGLNAFGPWQNGLAEYLQQTVAVSK